VLTHFDLFSGIGGFALAGQWVGGIKTIGFCEIEDYGCKTLEKNFPGIPIYKDVRDLHPDEFISRDGRIDFLTAGPPCQDLSVAGSQAGIEADRSGLFFQITRLSDEIYAYCGTRPSLVLENVSNLLAGAGGSWARTVYGELACRGYCIEWKVVGAKDVGAPHWRKRWWAIAYVANSNRKGLEEWQGQDTSGTGQTSRTISCGGFWRMPERRLGGVADGIPDWLDEPGDIPRVTTGQKTGDRVARLKGLGNSVVPQCAMIPLMRLKEILARRLLK